MNLPQLDVIAQIAAEIERQRSSRDSTRDDKNGKFLDVKNGINKYFVLPDPNGELAKKSYVHYGLGQNGKESVPCPAFSHPKLNINCPICYASRLLKEQNPSVADSLKRYWANARTLVNVIPVVIADEQWTGDRVPHLLKGSAALFEFLYQKSVDPDYNKVNGEHKYWFDPSAAHALKITRRQDGPDPKDTKYTFDLLPTRVAVADNSEAMELVTKNRFKLASWVGYKKEHYDKAVGLANQLISYKGGTPIPPAQFPPYISVDEAKPRAAVQEASPSPQPAVATPTIPTVAAPPPPPAQEQPSTPTATLVRNYEDIDPTKRQPRCFGIHSAPDPACGACPYEDACMMQTKRIAAAAGTN